MKWKNRDILEKVGLAGFVLGSAIAFTGAWRADNYINQNPYRNDPVLQRYAQSRETLAYLKSTRQDLSELEFSSADSRSNTLASLDSEISTLQEGVEVEGMEIGPIIAASKDYFNNKVLPINKYHVAPSILMVPLATILASLGQRRRHRKEGEERSIGDKSSVKVS